MNTNKVLTEYLAKEYATFEAAYNGVLSKDFVEVTRGMEPRELLGHNFTIDGATVSEVEFNQARIKLRESGVKTKTSIDEELRMQGGSIGSIGYIGINDARARYGRVPIDAIHDPYDKAEGKDKTVTKNFVYEKKLVTAPFIAGLCVENGKELFAKGKDKNYYLIKKQSQAVKAAESGNLYTRRAMTQDELTQLLVGSFVGEFFSMDEGSLPKTQQWHERAEIKARHLIELVRKHFGIE